MEILLYLNRMAKIVPSKPFLLLLYGYPGAGKTYFARQLSENMQVAHLQFDRIRAELIKKPRYDNDEAEGLTQLMNYMAEEFLSAGLSVVYDMPASRARQRLTIRELARRNHAQPLLVWFQLDQETAFLRNVRRDRRRADDKYTPRLDRTTFDAEIAYMQNPVASEDYVVVSGKHLFNMQQSAVVSKLRDLGVLSSNDASQRVIKPGLVNLIPGSQGRADMSRRNISIRS